MVPTLRVVMEHITTLEGVEFVTNAREGVCGTITVQHLMLNRNALFSHNGVVIFFVFFVFGIAPPLSMDKKGRQPQY
jgi:dihydroorotase